MTSRDTDDENPAAKRNSRWPEIDIWLVVVVLIVLAILALLTFELWMPHSLPH